jgi:hypothetical protein
MFVVYAAFVVAFLIAKYLQSNSVGIINSISADVAG